MNNDVLELNETGDVLLSCSPLADWEIKIPNSVTSIDEGAFSGCTSLTSVEIPNSVTSISEGAFAFCSGLENIFVSEDNPSYKSDDGVLYTRDMKLLLCFPSPKDSIFFRIPNSVTSIGSEAFLNCSGLISVEIPNSVTSIGDGAFASCTGLTSVEIPNSVTSIGEGAFAYCSGLTSVEIPNSLISIGKWAFNGCTGLTSVEIPNSVTSIGEGAFASCMNLMDIFVSEDNPSYKSDDGVLYTRDMKVLLCFPSKKDSALFTIPNSVTSIGKGAFSYCSGLTSVEIPNSLISIGKWAFEGVENLKEIHMRIEHIENVEIECDFSSFVEDNCILYVPVGTGYAYRHHPVFGRFKHVEIERKSSKE